MDDNAALQKNEDEIAELSVVLRDQMTQARTDNDDAIAEIKDWRTKLKAIQERADPPYDGACELVPPFVKESLLAIQAEVSPSILDTKPFLHAEPGDLGEDMSEQWELYHQSLIFDEMRARSVFESVNYAGLQDGCAIMMHEWYTDYRTVPMWQITQTSTVDPVFGIVLQSGKPRRKRIEQVQAVYDWPKVSYIPIEHFLCFPAADADIRDSEGCTYRSNINANALIVGALAGDFDSEAVDKLLDWAGDQPTATRPEDTRHEVQNNPNIRTNRARNWLTLTECYWRLPAKNPKYPWADWLITIHEESGIIVRAKPLTMVFDHGERPFVAYRPYANIRGLFADSVSSTGSGHVQDAKMVLFRYAVDALAFGVNPRHYVDVALYGKIKKTFEESNKPNGLMPMPSAYFANGGRQLQQVPIGIRPSDIIPLLELLDQEGQGGSGATDTLKGLTPGGQITARQAQFMMEASKKTIAHLIQHLSESTSDSGQQIHELVRQYQDHESASGLWTRINKQPPEAFALACQGRYIIAANSVSETANKMVIAERAIERHAILVNVPEVQIDPELAYNDLHDTLRDTGTRAPEDYVGDLQRFAMNRQKLIQLQAAQMAMQAVGGAAGGAEGKREGDSANA